MPGDPIRRSTPIPITIPDNGVIFAESVHRSDFYMEPNSHAFHKIVLIVSGSVVYETDESQAQAEAGTLFIVPNGRLHRFRDAEPSTLLILCFDDSFVHGTTERLRVWQAVVANPTRHLHHDIIARRRVESLWRRSLLEQTLGQIGSTELVCLNAIELLVILARLPAATGEDPARARVRSLYQELEATFFEKWDIDRAASRSNLSRRHFCKLFREIFGVSFLEKLTACRMEHAAKLLAHGGHSIVGVAFSSGCEDLSHFYRLFRQYYGMTPKQWMERNRGGSGRFP